jgi:hypothetical protein
MALRAATIALVAASVLSWPASAQVGTQLVVTMTLAAPVKPTGASYYVAFTVDDTILGGPQGDSTNWTHYVLYREGRFFFGRVPSAPFRPFGFEAIRPPRPYPYGEIAPERRSLRVRIPVADLQTDSTTPTRIKMNFVTLDDQMRPADALGPGVSDRFGFITVDLRRDIYLNITDPPGDAADPALDITGGSVQVTVP